MTSHIPVKSIYIVTPDFLHFVGLVMRSLDIECTCVALTSYEFDIIIPDMETAFLLKLHDFNTVWHQCFHGDTENYQFEMLDMHTAKDVASKIREQIQL